MDGMEDVYERLRSLEMEGAKQGQKCTSHFRETVVLGERMRKIEESLYGDSEQQGVFDRLRMVERFVGGWQKVAWLVIGAAVILIVNQAWALLAKIAGGG